MVNSELFNHFNQCGCSVSAEELFCGQLDNLILRGLRVLTLCNDGSGRSVNVANDLTYKYGIPSVRLSGGIKQFFENGNLSSCKSGASFVINKTPNIAVILTPEEIKIYYNFISNLRCSKYPNSNAAIESIRKMES